MAKKVSANHSEIIAKLDEILSRLPAKEPVAAAEPTEPAATEPASEPAVEAPAAEPPA